MSATTYAVDALTRHQVYLHRYGSGEIKKLLPFLKDMLNDVNRRILQESFTEFQMGRLAVLQQDLSILINESMTKLSGQLSLDLVDLGEYEASFTQRLLNKMITIESAGVTIDQLTAAINNTPMTLISGKSTQKLTVDQAVKHLAGTTTSNITRSIQMGIAEGKTTDQISREVTRIVTHRTRAQASAVIRTAANHTGTVARKQVYQENSDVMDGEEFIATLDDRTTLVCGGHDGKRFALNEGPEPALHFNCRSIRVPVVNDAFVVGGLKGARPSVGADGGQVVSAQSTYGGWLRKQPAAFQDEALGPERAKLFRNGGLSIDKFTDDRGITYTLDQLKGLEPQAFERAGII